MHIYAQRSSLTVLRTLKLCGSVKGILSFPNEIDARSISSAVGKLIIISRFTLQCGHMDARLGYTWDEDPDAEILAARQRHLLDGLCPQFQGIAFPEQDDEDDFGIQEAFEWFAFRTWPEGAASQYKEEQVGIHSNDFCHDDLCALAWLKNIAGWTNHRTWTSLPSESDEIDALRAFCAL